MKRLRLPDDSIARIKASGIKRLKYRKLSPKAKGGIMRSEKLTPERRAEIARLAAEARWKASKEVIQQITESEIAKTNAPTYIVSTTETPTLDNFVQATGSFAGKTHTLPAKDQWDYFNTVPQVGSLVVIGSCLKTKMLTRVAYDYFTKAIPKSTKSRWLLVDYSKSLNLSKDCSLILVDNVHPEMDARKYTALQDIIHDNQAKTRIIVVHGQDPLEFSFNVLKHMPDIALNVNVRQTALKQIFV